MAGLDPVCAEGRGPMVFRDGDPLHDVCLAIDPIGLRPHRMFGGLREGVTKITATYDGDRLTMLETDCGLDEPLISTMEWSADGRLGRYRGPWDLDTSVDVAPEYVDGKLAAHQVVYDSEDGTRYERRREFTLDTDGRIATEGQPTGMYPETRTLVYDGERLVTFTRMGIGFAGEPFEGSTDFSYLEDGRLIGIHVTSVSDPDLDELSEVEWSSETEGRATDWYGATDFEIDAAGRLVRKEIYDLDGHHYSTITWEWDSEGRLVEYWARGE